MRTLRTLLILTRRQTVDNGAGFVAAALLCVLVISTLVTVMLTEELSSPGSYAATMCVVPALLLAVGSCFVGIWQVSSDRAAGVSETLSVLPVRPIEVTLARIVTGMLIILTVLVPCGILGAILWRLLGPPSWLYRGWICDVFGGVVLLAAVCYGLGTLAGHYSTSFAKALHVLPVPIILTPALVVKGFGWELALFFLPFVVALAWLIIRRTRGRLMAALSTGCVVLVLLALPAYWARYLCDLRLAARIPDEGRKTEVRPIGLVSLSGAVGPNAADPSYAYGEIYAWSREDPVVHSLSTSFDTRLGHPFQPFWESLHLIEPLGIFEYISSRAKGEHLYSVGSYFSTEVRLVQFENMRGKFLCRVVDRKRWSDGLPLHEPSALCAGPNGVSGVPGVDLGQFVSPVVGPLDVLQFYGRRLWYRPYAEPILLYDAGQRRFFAIDFEGQAVRSGPEVKNVDYAPVDLGVAAKSHICHVGYGWPVPLRDGTGPHLVVSHYRPVVDELGRVSLLDPNTLELVGPAGVLPHPRTLFGFGSCKPKDLLGYNTTLLAVHTPGDSKNDNIPGERYAGMIAASVSRQSTSLALAVFDRYGNHVSTAYTKMYNRKKADSHPIAGESDIPYSAAFAAWSPPWGPALTLTKYLVESAQPPALALASYAMAYSFEADATYRAVFLMPNSFVALQRDGQTSLLLNTVCALLVMAPAMLLSGLLAWRVTKDAIVIGLSPRERRLWRAGTFLFGLPAYITYRLVRPKCVLTVCRECGRGRRVDRDVCHQCGSGWDWPELEPPTWRIIGRRKDNGTALAQAE